MNLATWLETLLQDLRHALRVWRKRPLVALTAILTIGLGAGMNVAVFQVTWNVMLKPLLIACAPSASICAGAVGRPRFFDSF